MTKKYDNEYEHDRRVNTTGAGNCSQCGRVYGLVDGLLEEHKVKRTPWATRGRQCRGVHQLPVK